MKGCRPKPSRIKSRPPQGGTALSGGSWLNDEWIPDQPTYRTDAPDTAILFDASGNEMILRKRIGFRIKKP